MDRAAGNTRLLAEELAVSEDPHADLARVRILLKGLIAECKFWQATALLPRSCPLSLPCQRSLLLRQNKLQVAILLGNAMHILIIESRYCLESV